MSYQPKYCCHHKDMAINSYEGVQLKLRTSSGRIQYEKFSETCSIASTTRSKCQKVRSLKSPYLAEDKVYLITRETEKKFVNKKKANGSSPLGASIYTVNSDEFKPKKKMKKNKKSVLTLPNEPAPKPQECTVSDMNESDYFNKEEKPTVKPKKRLPAHKAYKDDMKIYKKGFTLDSSSTDISKTSKASKRQSIPNQNNVVKTNAHDVWAMLKNMNWFQHRPSPPMSEEESVKAKPNKKIVKRKQMTNDGRVFKTQESEEFTFIKLNSIYGSSCSPTTSLDRITVIDKKDDFNNLSDNFGEPILNEKTCAIKNKGRKRSPRQCKTINNSEALEKKQYKTKNKMKLKSKAHNKVKDIEESEKRRDNNYLESLCKGDSLLLVNKTNTISLDKMSNVDILKTLNVINSGSSKAGYIHSDYFKADKEVNRNITKKAKAKRILNVMETEKEKICSLQPQLQKKRVSIKRNPCLDTIPIQKEVKPSNDTGKQKLDVKFPIVFIGQDDHGTASVLKINESNSLLSFVYEPRHTENVGRLITNREQNKINKKVGTDYQTTKKISNAVVQDENVFLKLSGKNLEKRKDCANTSNEIEQKYTIIDNVEINKKSNPLHHINEKGKTSPKIFTRNHISPGLLEGQIHNNFKSKIKVAKKQIAFVENVHPISANNSETTVKFTKNQFHKVTQNEDSTKRNVSKSKISWAKARCIHDFIESVIDKTLSGIYHNGNSKPRELVKYKQIKRMSPTKLTVLTEHTDNNKSSNSSDIANNVDDTKNHCFVDPSEQNIKAIRTNGAFKNLEIDSFVKNKIAVKDIKSNVMVQFDINVSLNPDIIVKRESNQSLISEPVVQENKLKVFKCKTTIVNSMLPAEICTLLPKVMRIIMEARRKANCVISVLPLPDINERCTESFQCDNVQPILKRVSPPLYVMKWSDGFFTNKLKTKSQIPKLEYNVGQSFVSSFNMPKNLFSFWVMNPRNELGIEKLSQQSYFTPEPDRGSKALQLFNNNQNVVCPTIKKMNLVDLLGALKGISQIKCSIGFNKYKRDIRIDVGLTNGLTYQASISISVYKEPSLHLKNVSANTCLQVQNVYMNNKDKSKCLEYTDKHLFGKMHEEASSCKNTKIVYKPKKAFFLQNRRKSKSTTNISEDKRHIFLSKIKHVEDFFQVLGSTSMLSTVFDGYDGSKILSCLKEMSCWTKEINSQQAMLILLLVNKKENETLKRYTPIILQGIAVKRITRAIELDMEMEVIEKEMHNYSKFESLTFIPSQIQKQDSLFEELLWIAKTTASDYQKPFNESSIKLLKSLLHKRKKLNPSYLRVMARYVGLGLLKPVKEHK